VLTHRDGLQVLGLYFVFVIEKKRSHRFVSVAMAATAETCVCVCVRESETGTETENQAHRRKRTIRFDLYTWGEVTSQYLWLRYDRHFVGITGHNVWS